MRLMMIMKLVMMGMMMRLVMMMIRPVSLTSFVSLFICRHSMDVHNMIDCVNLFIKFG